MGGDVFVDTRPIRQEVAAPNSTGYGVCGVNGLLLLARRMAPPRHPNGTICTRTLS